MPERPEDLHPHRLVEEHGAARTLLPDLSGAEPTQEGVRGLAFFQHRVETEGNIFGTARGFLACPPAYNPLRHQFAGRELQRGEG